MKSHSIKPLLAHYWPFLPLTLLTMYLASYAIWTDNNGNIVTALTTGWGDMLLHIRAATFYAQQTLPNQSFLLSGQPIGYAWPADYLSSLLQILGLSISASLALPTILFTGLFVWLLQIIPATLTKSRLTGIFTTILFLGFSGVSGFIALPTLFNSSTTWTQTLRTLPYHLTAWHDQNLIILNPFIMMLHQRSYLLGFPLLLLAFAAAYHYLTTKHTKALYFLSLVTLALALIHPFTWAAWLLIFPPWMILMHLTSVQKYSKNDWIKAMLSYTVAAALGYLIIKSLQPVAGSTIAWHPGWIAATKKENWLLFWLKNIGLFAALAPLGIFHLWKINRPLALATLAALTPFLAANLFQFAPWDWDNTKILAPTWLLLALATGSLLAHWWHKPTIPARRTLIVTTICICIFSGSLEITRLLTLKNQPLTLASPTDLQIGESIRQQIPLNTTILTAPSPPNHPIFMLTGHPSFIAYEGWLWSQGWANIYQPRITAAQDIFAGTPQTKALLKLNNIDAVAIGPPEKTAPWNANQAYFDQTFPILLKTGPYTLYDVR